MPSVALAKEGSDGTTGQIQNLGDRPDKRHSVGPTNDTSTAERLQFISVLRDNSRRIDIQGILILCQRRGQEGTQIIFGPGAGNDCRRCDACRPQASHTIHVND
jgi:hypothetical protein